MASYTVEWKKSAAKELKRLPQSIILRIVEAVEELAADPFPAGCRKLKGSEHTFRIRLGDYRAILGFSKPDYRLSLDGAERGKRLTPRTPPAATAAAMKTGSW